jgi:hypothetical protein
MLADLLATSTCNPGFNVRYPPSLDELDPKAWDP